MAELARLASIAAALLEGEAVATVAVATASAGSEGILIAARDLCCVVLSLGFVVNYCVLHVIATSESVAILFMTA